MPAAGPVVAALAQVYNSLSVTRHLTRTETAAIRATEPPVASANRSSSIAPASDFLVATRLVTTMPTRGPTPRPTRIQRRSKEEGMRMRSLWATALVVIFAAVPASAPQAQSAAPAIAGQVTSAEEGAMEGVLVSARKEDSTITVTVVSDEQGRYRFPAARLAPG